MARLIRKRNVIIVFRRGKHVVDYRDSAGKRHRISFDTPKEAAAHKREVELAFEGFVSIDSKERPTVIVEPVAQPAPVAAKKSVTLKQAIKLYRDNTDGTQMKATKNVEKSHFETLFLYLVNEQKITDLGEIQLVHLDAFQNYLVKGNEIRRALAASSVNRMFFGTYSPFFNKCVAWDLIAKSPMHGPHGQKGLRRLPEAEPDIKPWNADQIKIAIGALEPHVSEAIYYQAETGCREVDLERCIWDHVDLERRRIKFTSYKGGKIRVAYLPMGDQLFDFLVAKRERARRRFMAKGSDHLFVNTKGNPLTTDYIGKAVARVRDQLDDRGHLMHPTLAGLTPYGIRHAFIDGLVTLGIHPRDIQLLARHAKFETTTRYTHRNNDHLRSVVNQSSASRKVVNED